MTLSKANQTDLIWITLRGAIITKDESFPFFTGLNLPRIWSTLFRLSLEDSEKPAF